MAGPDNLANLLGGGRKSLAQWKALFFDRSVIERAAGKAKLKALSKYGAVVRRTAQTSMRYRKKASQPGTPPSAHKSKRLAALKKLGRTKYNGALLREMLFFAYEPRSGTTVVGPLGFKSARGTPVPALHEFGGERTPYPKEKYLKGKGKSARLIVLKGSVKYPARPFMGPALKKTLVKFPLAFRDTVSR